MRNVDLSALAAAAPARRPREAEIIDAAAEVFHEKGYAAATIQDVADAVGILKGSLYYYIDSKEDLLFEIVRDAHHFAMRNLADAQQVGGDAITRLRALIQIHILSNIANRVKIGVFFHDFRSLSPERRRQVIADRDIYESYVRRLIEEGQKEGTIAADIDAKMAVMALLGMMNWIYQWYRPDAEGGMGPQELAETFAAFVLDGLEVREEPSPHRESLWPEGAPGIAALRKALRRAG